MSDEEIKEIKEMIAKILERFETEDMKDIDRYDEKSTCWKNIQKYLTNKENYKYISHKIDFNNGEEMSDVIKSLRKTLGQPIYKSKYFIIRTIIAHSSMCEILFEVYMFYK